MPADFFTSLPFELHVQVFCDLDDLLDVVHLASTCSTLRAVQATPSAARQICSAVAPRSVPCLKDAEDLLRAQQRSGARPAPAGDALDVSDLTQLATWARCMHRNAQYISSAADLFEETLKNQQQLARYASKNCGSRPREVLSTAERNAFAQAFYRLHALAVFSPAERAAALARAGAAQLHQWRDLLGWALPITGDMKKTRAGLDHKIWTGPLLHEVGLALQAK